MKKEEARREEVEKRAYVYRKYGFMNFVSGGFLVGDKIQTRDELKKETEAKVEVKSEPESDGAENKKDKKRKRKERDEVQAIVDGAEEEPKLKRKKKSMDLREASKAETDAESGSKKDKKQKRDKKDKDKKKSKKSKTSSASDPEPSAPDAPSPQSDPEPLTDKARRKAEKKVRKEEKKLKKALKKATKAAKSDSSSESEDEETTPSTSVPTSVSATGTSTPVLSTAGLTFSARGMHAVRQRYIRQKKAASMDPQALKEVCWDAHLHLTRLTSGVDFHDQDSIVACWRMGVDFRCIAGAFGTRAIQIHSMFMGSCYICYCMHYTILVDICGRM